MTEPNCNSTGQAARRFGQPRWRVQRLLDDGEVPEGPRIGNCRTIREQDMPLLEQALRRRGWLPTEPPAADAASS